MVSDNNFSQNLAYIIEGNCDNSSKEQIKSTSSQQCSQNFSSLQGRKRVGRKRGKPQIDDEEYILVSQQKVDEMKADLKQRSKKLTIEERKMEANRISSLQARIRSKMHNKAL